METLTALLLLALLVGNSLGWRAWYRRLAESLGVETELRDAAKVLAEGIRDYRSGTGNLSDGEIDRALDIVEGL